LARAERAALVMRREAAARFLAWYIWAWSLCRAGPRVPRMSAWKRHREVSNFVSLLVEKGVEGQGSDLAEAGEGRS
jgi:hypothetical protein